MPPKVKMTPEQVAEDVVARDLNIRPFKDKHATKHKGINRVIGLTTQKPNIADPWVE